MDLLRLISAASGLLRMTQKKNSTMKFLFSAKLYSGGAAARKFENHVLLQVLDVCYLST